MTESVTARRPAAAGFFPAIILARPVYGALGDTKASGLTPTRQEHYLGPILMHHLSHRFMMHQQLAIGLSKSSDNLVRLAFGYDF